MKCRFAFGFAAMSALVTVTSAASNAAEQLDMMVQGVRNACVKKSGADLELVKGIREGKFTEGDQKLKCYVKCIMNISKTLKNGRIDVDAMGKQITIMYPESTAVKLLATARKCDAETNEDDVCDYTWSFLKCTYNSDPDLFFFP